MIAECNLFSNKRLPYKVHTRVSKFVEPKMWAEFKLLPKELEYLRKVLLCPNGFYKLYLLNISEGWTVFFLLCSTSWVIKMYMECRLGLWIQLHDPMLINIIQLKNYYFSRVKVILFYSVKWKFKQIFRNSHPYILIFFPYGSVQEDMIPWATFLRCVGGLFGGWLPLDTRRQHGLIYTGLD